jgi:lysophospholipase L1-like esterase
VWSRYVALGDSTSEGLEDPLPDGSGYRGWTDRLAERVATLNPELTYANLAVRGKLARQVREDQLDAALALEPDLVTVVAGLNDVLRRSCDVAAVTADMDVMIGALRAIAARHGAVLVDLERHPVTSDPRLWHPDRLHANSEGHARIAAAIAHALELPGADEAWAAPLPPLAPARRHAALAGHLVWGRRHFAPWILRRLRGVSSGDGRVAKRPEPRPVLEPDQEP